ncbi:DUF4192 domain-containing protein [Mycobacterium sp. CBMA293]|uniref:DUF4192 domain-containing protein n=1 Tax=unclassified Mycolicibacterium TaxID=2636767 RepID=UPI0012DD4F43|nr:MULTISPECIES: DUF4192 domain-containing protein [unclassified Mycolicibacterium]MUL44854.1 DUF4192 domain-containing protein [Mycolicibacterium sp. CBMA 360]MUL58037.1 DUF4192 domain-containing protein [Mycolicibacterium sp. CBMA 335]MUL73495.1 DUF4192 domain-containing protein [Mycolicibacterium sp. CBMA 311]MUL95447.1 DUF4192 domain-containing protein [Mycolicibacterium sp. CBMA 230]MUM07469.1 hypothetical protein [Mycolicibacterium sp. CBMA 213]
MTTFSSFDFQLNRPGALIAAVPAVLGFVPEKSLVLVTVADGEMGVVLRVDLSDGFWGALPAALGHLADMAASADADAAVAVIVDEKGVDCQMCADLFRDVSHELEEALSDHGIELFAVHVVDKVAAGGRWHCADGCGNAGVVEDPGSSPVAMAAVLDGRRLYSRRAELVDVVAVADVRQAAALQPAIEKLAAATDYDRRPDSEVRVDVEHALACARTASGAAPLPDDDVVRLACAVSDSRVRDTLYALAVGENAAAAESLWASLTRTLPAPWRVEALVLLAFSAYARGDGPLAGVALDAALDVDSRHRMAGMLDMALQSGMRPDRIRELALTGYKLADRLGVQMPPRRPFGRSA